ncbi:MAG TPA: RNA 2',3'-cyclic phosphodiesterase [Candidatus Binatia bacterium]|nr:RNA 2',3'-cyclic phosphodiesterase [Candidatus Binatia bacterium]
MRIFTAIPLPQAIKDKFTEISRGKLPIPYVNTGNFHITLNFLGELETDQVEMVKNFWENGLPEIRKFWIEYDKVIKFRQQLHMTIKENKKLNDLHLLLRDKFTAMGYKASFPKYYAHTTIGNLHMDKVMNKERKIDNFPNEDLKQLSFEAESIVMYESKLLLHHAKYIPLAEHKLV